MKKISICLVFFCCLIPLVNAYEINVGNQSFSVEFIAEEMCGELQENIFRIERINYTSGMEAENIVYTTTCNKKETNISKEIKKYSESKTGSCTFVQSNNYSVTFEYNNKSFEWNLNVLCEEEKEEENNTTNPISCFEEFNIEVNKEIFIEDEQLTLDFSLDVIPDYLEIDYWIETLNGSYLKNPRSTTNIDTKKHTFKNINLPEQGAYVIAQAKDNCSSQERKKLILLQGEPLEEIFQETVLSIEQIEQIDNEHILVNIRLERGNSRSSVVKIFLKTTEEKTLFEEKIKLETTGSSATFSTIIPVGKENEGIVYVEGLGLEDEGMFLIEKEKKIQLLNVHTKQKYYTNNITWYVRSKQEKPTLLYVETNAGNRSMLLQKTGERITNINIPYDGGSIFTSISDGETTINRTDFPKIEKKEIKVKKTIKQPVLTTRKTSLEIEEKTPFLVEEKEDEKESHISKNALYGLFGSIIAGSSYLLLKEQ